MSRPTDSINLGSQGLGPTDCVAATLDRGVTTINGTAPTSGTVELGLLWIPAGAVITSITFISATTALSAGTHQYFGLYDTSRNRLAVTADATSAAWAANTAKTLSLTADYKVTSSGLYYVGILVTATTMPTLAGTTLFNSAISNVAPILCGTSSSGQTSLPDPAGAITATVNRRMAFLNNA